MADEIRQEIGLDASKALTALTQLQDGLTRYNTSLDNSVVAMQRFNTMGGKTVSALQHIATNAGATATQMSKLNKIKLPTVPKIATGAGQIDAVADATEDVGAESDRTAQRWTASWQTMARVVATQTIVRALNIIRQSLKASIGDAVKFQRSIAEIATISAPAVGGMTRIAAVVQEVSDAFNVDIGDTAEAAYQTISNQVAKTDAELQSFLGTAAKFAKITKTDMSTSVNLLSGVLNAFGKSVSETDDVAAKFFKTIELGRTRAEELALGYGTVAPIADKLGISMEELNASVATLTINGIKTDKAFTQIRGTMQAFLKPTEDMKDVLKELGFASGEQLLQANNLQEALKLVAGVTDGTAASIAKLFPRIRGLTGVLTALDDEAGHFNKTMEEQKTALSEAYDKAYKLVIETDAEKVTKELRQLKNFFTVEFGQSVLELGVKISRTIGGAGALVDVFKVIGPLLFPVGAGLGFVALALAAVQAKAALARTQLSGLHKALLAYTAAIAAVGAGQFIAARISDSYEAEYKATKEMLGRELEARKLKIAGEIAAERGKVGELTKLFARALAETRKDFLKVRDASIESNKEITSDVKQSTDRIIAQRQKMVSALQNQVSKAGDNIVASEKRAGTLRDNLDDQLFSRKIARLGDETRFAELTQKAQELGLKATRKLKRAFTEDERGEADAEFARAKAFADQALSLADTTGSRQKEQKALGTLKNLTGDLIKAEKSYQQNVAASAAVSQKRANVEQKRVDQLKKKQKELLDAFSITDKESGELLSPEDRAKQAAKAGKLLREFIDISGDPLDVSQMLSFTGVAAQLQSSMHEFEIRSLVVSEAALGKLSSVIDAAINRRKEDPAFGLAESALGRDIKPGADESEALTELEAKYNTLFDAKKANLEATKALQSSQKGLAAFMTEAGEAAARAEKFGLLELSKVMENLTTFGKGTGATDAFVEQLNKSYALIEKVEAGGGKGVHPDELLRSSAALQSATTNLSSAQQAVFSGVTTDVANVLESAKQVVVERLKLQKLERESGSVADIDSGLSTLGQAINFLKAPQLAAEAMSTAIETADTAQQGVATAAQTAASAHQSSAASVAQMAADSATVATNLSNIDSRAGTDGGRVGYFANGGRGTDTIPAMLSAGETVTNARSSRRFFSQLQAMNAGQKPVYRNDGGDTFNTTVGDINVSGASNPEQTARVVMAKIRREQRRGSAR